MNRLSYDSCEYNKTLEQSVGPLSFILDPIKYENCKKCRMELGIVGGTAVSHISGSLVDLESDLRNQTRPHSHCPSLMYSPNEPLQGKGIFYKQGQFQPIDTTARHLQACQMHDYAGVPPTPTLDLYQCQRNSAPLASHHPRTRFCPSS
jgi:hypothetical protein